MPDTVTASDEYALRFSGDAGSYLLSVQEASLANLLTVEPQLPGDATFLDHSGIAVIVQQLRDLSVRTSVVKESCVAW